MNILALAKSYRSALREFRPDIVHVHSSVAGIACRIVPVPRNVKLIYCAHGWAFSRETTSLSNRLTGLVERILSWKSDAIVCLSRRDLDLAMAKGIPAAKLHVIPNGICSTPSPAKNNSGVMRRWRDEAVRVLFVGRFDFQKGFDTFTQALSQLTTSHHAIAIGMPVVDRQGPLSLPPNVEHIGWQPRSVVHEYMASADVVVLPSRWEGAPITVLEAMRSGTAVIGTNVGAIPEQVADNLSGVIISPNDAPRLAEVLSTHSPTDFKEMGTRGRERFMQLFSSIQMNTATLNLYSNLAVDLEESLAGLSA